MWTTKWTLFSSHKPTLIATVKLKLIYNEFVHGAGINEINLFHFIIFKVNKIAAKIKERLASFISIIFEWTMPLKHWRMATRAHSH